VTDAAGAAKTRALLAAIDVYKVGHHGSLNATPKKLLWQAFRNRNKSGKARLRTLLSTMPGKHGKTQSRTEVPRRTLLDALKTESDLHTTTTLKFSATGPLCHVITV
jgi:hypothetical protein